MTVSDLAFYVAATLAFLITFDISLFFALYEISDDIYENFKNSHET